MSVIQANKTVGHSSGCARITFPGQNLTTNKIGIYSFIVGLAQEGISYDDENILGRTVETENVFNCRGVLATKQGGNQTVNEKTFSLAYNDDFNFVVNNISPEINRSTMASILKATKFKYGAAEILPLGTQGFRWLGTATFETLDTFYIWEEDGKLISPDKMDSNGDPTLVDNGVKTPYEKSALMMVEFLYSFNDTLVKGDRFVYCLAKMSTFTEGGSTSPNSYSIDFERFSDARSIKEYYVTGGNMEGTFPESGTAQKSLDVKYVTNVVPTGGGLVGDRIAVILPAAALTVATSISAAAGSTTMTGIGTAFTTELVVGSIITVDSQIRIVSAIASDTSLTVSVAFAGAISAVNSGVTTNRLDVYKVVTVGSTYSSIAASVTFTKGTNIHFEKIATNVDLDDTSTTDYYGVIVVSGAGTNQIASVFDDDLDGTGNKYFSKFDWDYSAVSMTPYEGE